MAFTLFAIGCGKTNESAPTTAVAMSSEDGHDHGDSHDHSGWWCKEHGVPEEICGLCDTKLAADFQAKGDWCQPHDRPRSQCFTCEPALEQKFAALYEAKFGEKPPRPIE